MTRLLLLNPPLNLVVGNIVTNLHELSPRHDSLISLLRVHWLRGVLDDGFEVGQTVPDLWREGGGVERGGEERCSVDSQNNFLK